MSAGRVSVALRELTLSECAAALGVSQRSRRVQQLVTLPFRPAAARLGRELERFDAEVPGLGLSLAAARALQRFGVALSGGPFAGGGAGPLLVLSNHPGIYDALVLFASLPRPDLKVLTAERAFLRAIPELAERFIFVPDATEAASADLSRRGSGLLRAIAHLRRGGALLQFGAGRIEPDPAFQDPRECILPWQPGSGALAVRTQRLGGQVVVAVVAGVHSRRAKHSWLVRAAEARGVTTFAGLLQLSAPFLSRVNATVSFSKVLPALPREAKAATRALEAVARELVRESGPG